MTKIILGNTVSNEYKKSYTAVTTHQFLTYLLQILTALLDFKSVTWLFHSILFTKYINTLNYSAA